VGRMSGPNSIVLTLLALLVQKCASDGTQFACFTRTKVHLVVARGAVERICGATRRSAAEAFTSSGVSIGTFVLVKQVKLRLAQPPEHLEIRLRGQHLSLCTSKASKVSTVEHRVGAGQRVEGSICPFVPVKPVKQVK